MNPLRDLDERVVPALARGLRRGLDALQPRQRVARERPTRRRVAPERPLRRRAPRQRPPRRRGSALGRLDDRFARRGPLGVVREVPQVGLVVVAALLAAGAAAAAVVSAGDTPSDAAAVAGCAHPPVDRTAAVGPPAGVAVPAYVRGAAQQLADCLVATPGSRRLAVVSLSGAEYPATTAEDLRGVTLTAVFVQLPAASATPRVLPLTGASDGSVRVADAIDAAYDRAQAAFLGDRARQLAFAGSTAATTPTDVAGRADADATAAQDALLASQLRLRCACVYGAVAVGTVTDLAALVSSDVRVVALAPAGATGDELTARPLLPSEVRSLGAAAPPTPVAASSP